MDQLTSTAGRAGHALLIDCRSLALRPIRMPEDAAIVVCDSGVRHRLASSEYNARRAESEEAARRLGRPTLRDVTPDVLERSDLRGPLRARARHVVTEIERTRRGAEALAGGDLVRFGALMGESHRSLREDYEVSAPELDALVAAAAGVPGVYGSRLTGAGFGGCTVTLASPSAVPRLGAALSEALQDGIGRRPTWFVTRAAGGAGEIRPPS